VPRSLRRASKRPKQPNPRQPQQPRAHRQQLKQPVRLRLRNLPQPHQRLLEQPNLLLRPRLLRKFWLSSLRSLLPKISGRRLLLYRCASVIGGAKAANPGLASQSSALQHASAYGRKSITDMKQGNSLSFPKQRRLTNASEYERVKQDGLVRRGKLLMLSAAVVENSGLSRVGFITSRRLGSAVARNRVRRRLREIVRRHQHDLRQDFWIVLVARRDAVKASYRALEDEWLRLARRASILL
jgi:ribonuclease P protein component